MDADLLIVGGGPAGISTALFLAATEHSLVKRVLVLEKSRYPREKICGGAVGGRADKLLASIGVRLDIPAEQVSGMSIKAAGGALVKRSSGGPIGRVVRRIEHDAALADFARRRGVAIVENTRVTNVAIESDGVRVESTAGPIRARAIVGADGVGSVVRRALGLGRGRFSAQVVEVDTEPVLGDPPRDLLHFDICDRALYGYAWDFPTVVDGQRLVCRGVYELRDGDGGSGSERDVGEILADRLAQKGIPMPDRVKRFAERGISLAEPFASPRAVLVGEAAGIDPVLGEGIAQAIVGGAVAGMYLARCVRAGTFDFKDFRRAMMWSRAGLDMAIRSRATRFIYGGTRPLAERWVTSSSSLARAGMQYFAGERTSRWALTRALADLAWAALDD